MASGYARGSRCWVALLTAALMLCLGGARLWAQAGPVCEPTPEVRAAIDAVPHYQPLTELDWQFNQQRRTAIAALLQRYPDDLFVHRANLRIVGSEADIPRLVAEYKALYAQKPNDPEYMYLYGQALVGRDTPQSIKLFNQALKADPSFAWPHLGLVDIELSPVFLDKLQALANMKAFLTACPNSLEGYAELVQFDDHDLIAAGAARLRPLLAGRTDRDAISAWSTLWKLEFKAHPATEYGPLRAQVAADLKTLRALNLVNESRWYSTLRDGYDLINDQAQSDWAYDEGQRQLPDNDDYPGALPWNREHQRPSNDAPHADREAYYQANLKHIDEVLKIRPASADLWQARLYYLENRDDAPAAEIEATYRKAYDLARANAGPEPVDSYLYVNFAEALSRKHLLPADVVDLAQKGLERLADEARQPPYDLYATPEDRNSSEFNRVDNRLEAMEYEAGGYIDLKQLAKAQPILQQIDEGLQDLNAKVSERPVRKDLRLKAYAGREWVYWDLMARMADVENRRQDEMAYDQNALLARLGSYDQPAPGDRDELGDRAHKLWSSLGGSGEGWTMWYARKADALAALSQLSWGTANDPLPPFQLTDMKGKTWQLADLKGKEVFLNFWASW